MMTTPTMGLLGVLALSQGLAADAERTWDFTHGGDLQGWVALNDIREMTVRDGALHITVTGGDPYLYSGEARIGIETSQIEGLEVRMKSRAGGLGQVYWVTDESPVWYGPDRKSVRFQVLPDGEWHTYRVRLNRHPGWKGRLAQVRLDPHEIYVPPDEPAQIQIAYLRLYAPDPAALWGVDLSQPIATRGVPFRLYCRLLNDDVRPLEGGRARLELPEGLRLVSGSPEQALPEAPGGQAVAVKWSLLSERAGVFDLSCVVSLTGDHRRLGRRVYVSEPLPGIEEGGTAKVAFGSRGRPHPPAPLS